MELERMTSLSRLGPVAPDRRLSWREQHGHLGMCFFVSGERVLPSWPWTWTSKRLASEARLPQSEVVDKVGRIEVPPPIEAAFMYIYRLTGGSISGLLRKRASASPFTRTSSRLFLEQQRAHKYYVFTGRSKVIAERVRHSSRSTLCEKQCTLLKNEVN